MKFLISFFLPFVVGIVLFIRFLRRNDFLGNEITVRDCVNYQHKVDTSIKYEIVRGSKSAQDAANKLGLKLLGVPKDELHDCDSMLCPTEEENYCGVIKYDEKEEAYQVNFRIYHEIVHYIDDVGIGKRVKKEYAKDPSGETRSYKEQIINFKAAALAIPKDKLLLRLEEQKNKGLAIDEEFLRNLGDEFQQPEDTIRRRIAEVLL